MFLAITLSLVLAQQEETYWSVDYLTPPEGEVLEVGGMGFMSDGDMIVSFIVPFYPLNISSLYTNIGSFYFYPNSFTFEKFR